MFGVLAYGASKRDASDLAGEGIAPRRVAALVAGREPLLALLRRAVRPRVGIDLALRRLLDAVVTDRRSRVEGVRDLGVGDLLEITGGCCVVGPDTGEAVGLELGPDRAALGAGLVAAARLQEAKEVLDVVPVFMSDDIALREGTRVRAEARAELLEEVEVEVDQLIDRAVERPTRRRRCAAPAACGA